MFFKYEDINTRENTDPVKFNNDFKEITKDLSYLYNEIYQNNINFNNESKNLYLNQLYTGNKINKLRRENEINGILYSMFQNESFTEDELTNLKEYLINNVSGIDLHNNVSGSLCNVGYKKSTYIDFTRVGLKNMYFDTDFSGLYPIGYDKYSKLYVTSNNKVIPKSDTKVKINNIEISKTHRFYNAFNGVIESPGILWSTYDDTTQPSNINITIDLPLSNSNLANYIELVPFPQSGLDILTITCKTLHSNEEIIYDSLNPLYQKRSSAKLSTVNADNTYFNNALNERIFFPEKQIISVTITVRPSFDNNLVMGYQHIDVGYQQFQKQSEDVFPIFSSVKLQTLDDLIIEGSNLHNVEIEVYSKCPETDPETILDISNLSNTPLNIDTNELYFKLITDTTDGLIPIVKNLRINTTEYH